MQNFPDVRHRERQKTHRNIKNLSSSKICFFHRENILTILNIGWVPVIFSFKPRIILALHSIFTTFAGTIQLTVFLIYSIFLHTSLQLSNEVWASLSLSRIWPTKLIRNAVLASSPGGILKKISKNGKLNIFSS